MALADRVAIAWAGMFLVTETCSGSVLAHVEGACRWQVKTMGNTALQCGHAGTAACHDVYGHWRVQQTSIQASAEPRLRRP
eukprot:scaffold264588_cov16-Prasinocladus_malaysianus.AAC.1